MNKKYALFGILIIISTIFTPSVFAREDPYAALADFWGQYITPDHIQGIFLFLLLFAVFYILIGRVFSSGALSGTGKKEQQVISVVLAASVTYYSWSNDVLWAIWSGYFSIGIVGVGVFLLFVFLASLVHHGKGVHLSSKTAGFEKQEQYLTAKARMFDIKQQHLTKKEEKEARHIDGWLGAIDKQLHKAGIGLPSGQVTPKQLYERFEDEAPKIKNELKKIKNNILSQERQLKAEISNIQRQSKTIVFAGRDDKLALRSEKEMHDVKGMKVNTRNLARLQEELKILRREYKSILEELHSAKMIEKLIDEAGQLVNYIEKTPPRWGVTDKYINQLDQIIKKARMLDIKDEKLGEWRLKLERRVKRMDTVVVKQVAKDRGRVRNQEE